MTEVYQALECVDDDDSEMLAGWDTSEQQGRRTTFPHGMFTDVITEIDEHIVPGPVVAGVQAYDDWSYWKGSATAVRLASPSRYVHVQYVVVNAESAPAITAKELDRDVTRVFSKVAAKQWLKRFRSFSRTESAVKEFIPSKELMKVLLQGIEHFASKVRAENRPMTLRTFLDGRSRNEISKLFVSSLMDIIATISFRQSDGVYTAEPVTEKGEFAFAYLGAFQDVFPIWPTDLKEFQGLLKRDLTAFLREGGRVRGGWGEFYIQGDDIQARLTENNVARIEGDWVPARSVRR